MDWNDLPILVCLGMGLVGFSLMLAAFVLAAVTPGDKRIPAYLLLAGVALGCLYTLSLSIPGVVPWWDYSQWYTRLPALGVVIGVAVVGVRFAVRRRGRR